jgi:hypothetical protein
MVALSQNEHHIYYSQKTWGLVPSAPRLWELVGAMCFPQSVLILPHASSGKSALYPSGELIMRKFGFLLVVLGLGSTLGGGVSLFLYLLPLKMFYETMDSWNCGAGGAGWCEVG